MANEASIINNPDSLPAAASTGYQAQNTRALAATNGIDNSVLSITGVAQVQLDISGGIDVNGTLYSISAPAVLSLPARGRYYIFLDGTGNNLTPTLTTTPGTFNAAKNAIYTAGGKRVLNWIIHYEGSVQCEIEPILNPAAGRNYLPGVDTQPVTLITGATTWYAPRTKFYTFKLQAAGGAGGNATADATAGSVAYGASGGAGHYGYVRLFLVAGTPVAFTFGAVYLQMVIGGTTYQVRNGSAGAAASATLGAKAEGASTGENSTASYISNLDFITNGSGASRGSLASNGGSSVLGQGSPHRYAYAKSSGAGGTAQGYGAGGGGAFRNTNGTSNGGAGSPALAIIEG